MNTNKITLSPLIRRSIGFDHFNELFENLLRPSEDSGDSYPPYNIEKFGGENYRITMALAGFRLEDINITQHGNKLLVSGKSGGCSSSEEESEFLYKGIATRAFERKFSVADHVKVVNATFKDGLLRVDLLREVPEEEKPKQIQISS